MAAAVEPEESPLDQRFTDLRYETVDDVLMVMSVESSRRKCDWRALASVFGFSGRQVQLMQQDRREPCKGRLLVNVWEDLGDSSLRKFIYALKEANMGECLRTIMQDSDLKDADVDIPAVLQEYEQLKADRLRWKQCFPPVSKAKFHEVFYPHVRMGDNMPSSLVHDLRDDLVEYERNRGRCSPGDNVVSDPVLELNDKAVFISYCPESGIANRKFNNQLRRFAEFIQNQGFTLHFEPNSQAEIRSYGSVVTWKEACIKRSKNILVIVTPEYFKEDSKATESTRRRSVSKIEVDSHVLRQVAYSQDSRRIIPVVLDARKPARHQFPLYLVPLVTHSWPSGERELDLCLHDLPRYVLPKFGKKKVIKPIVINFPEVRRHKC